MGLVRSEWIKLTTTKSAYWLLAIAVGAAIGLGALMGAVVHSMSDSPEADRLPGGGASPLMALIGITLFTSSLVWITGILAVTGEYRYSTMKSTFLAAPKRFPAILAKTAVLLALGMIATAIAVCGALLIGQGLSGYPGWSPFSGEGLRLLWRFPVYIGFGLLASIGLAYFMRNAAGAISLVLVWTLGLESMVALIPKVGTTIQSRMPFLNGIYWVEGGVAQGTITWGEWTAFGWFALVSVAIFALGVFLTMRRDA